VTWNKWVRQIHRGLVTAFTLTFIANIVARAIAGDQAATLVTNAPLLPLGVRLLTGLCVFMLPYAGRSRR